MSEVNTPRRKLIEVALPLEAINREAAREKSIRHGHPSTLHLWWARRPLAACRAVLFAQLVDDPSAHPDRFPTDEAQEHERQRLFRLIERLVPWEATQDEKVLNEAREEIRQSCGDNLPEVLDPFCGGGSIPLEAQRLGLVAHGSDLNPVAVLITKALIELPARFADQPPVHPRDGDGRLAIQSWHGAQGLAEDVRYYGAWMREEAQRRIGHLYPPATLPDGRKATVIAWIWARTVTCPNPACRATMPLVRSFWLGKKKGKETWVRPVVEGGSVRFEIGYGASGPPIDGTVGRTGATCLVCNTPVPLAHVRAEGKAGRMGAQLMAIVAEGDRQRIYLPPDPEHEKAAVVPRPDNVPDAEVPTPSHDVDRLPMYGMNQWSDAFTNRQLTALATLSQLIGEVGGLLIAHQAEPFYSEAVMTYLALAIDRVADRNSTISGWDSSTKMEAIRNTFGRQAIQMTWDFAEGQPFGGSSGNLSDAITAIAAVIQRCPADPISAVDQRDARDPLTFPGLAVSTDPPYYDNVGYADLSDFFYVWLRQSLAPIYPQLFSTMATPKGAELIANPYRHADRGHAKRFFESGFEQVFTHLCRTIDRAFPLTVFYAFKQSESDASGVASTGWETMLGGLLRSGLAVTATWPMRTELGNRMLSSGTNALASSVVLVCRPRSETAGITDRRGFLAALHAELPQALRELQQGNIAPVDLAQAAIGPGMAVFSRYAKVVEPAGEAMPVRSALGLINQVLDEVLAEQEGEFDADTRFAIKWFEQYGFDEAGYDPAEGLARAMNVSVKGLEDASILVARGGRVRLLRRGELAADWDPATDTRMPVWEVTQQLVRALWDEGSEAKAGDLVRRLGGIGEVARDLAYRLYAICERRGWADDALGFNALVTSWPEIARRAASPAPVQQELGQ